MVGGHLDDHDALVSALSGTDAVLCALGPESGLAGTFGVTVMQDNLPLITTAMCDAHVDRLILLSAYGVGNSARTASPLARLAYKTVVASAYRDKQISETALPKTELEVTRVLPVILDDGPLNPHATVRPMAAVTKVSGLPKISRATVAAAMLDAAEDNNTSGKQLLVSAPAPRQAEQTEPSVYTHDRPTDHLLSIQDVHAWPGANRQHYLHPGAPTNHSPRLLTLRGSLLRRCNRHTVDLGLNRAWDVNGGTDVVSIRLACRPGFPDTFVSTAGCIPTSWQRSRPRLGRA
ncbi:NAD(P)H-binding protein [Rhodococcus sp. NCIMB 12038]|uniref:NAD(P)H-binding protein n=1 Tax=Rhodococcus sp. NCIMB 12038 TaxID=933800 RepID=UPI00358ECFA6